jgi:hypothetical protein
MAGITIRLETTLSKSAARWALFGAVFFLFPAALGSESVTMTTYYPSPSGVYTSMLTTGNTWLATQGSSNVGIGTTSPQARLDVSGSVNLKVDGVHSGPLKVVWSAGPPAGYYAAYAP